MKNKTWLMVIATALLLLATGCSNGKTEENAGVKESQSTEQKNEEYSFYKDAKKNERLYYKVDLDGDSFGKDSKIEGILHIDHGNYEYYYTGGLHTMSDLRDLSDKQILEKAIQWNEEGANDLVEEAKHRAQGFDESASDTIAKNLEWLNNYKYKKPETRKLQVKAASDSSGNNLEKEWIVLPTNDLNIRYYTFKNDETEIAIQYDAKLFRYSLSATQATADVYEKTYNLSTFGENYTLATLDTGLMKLDDLNEEGLLDEHADSPYYDVDTVDASDFIVWEE